MIKTYYFKREPKEIPVRDGMYGRCLDFIF